MCLGQDSYTRNRDRCHDEDEGCLGWQAVVMIVMIKRLILDSYGQ
jgi:hypothetical protein